MTQGKGREAEHQRPVGETWRIPLKVEPEVSQDGATGQEGAAHAGEQMPVRVIGWAVGLRHMIGLLDQLAVHFIP